MRIKTITCHDVYNVGASLQAYALQNYLKQRGHYVEIIDYKPEYLSNHYRLDYVPNARYRKRIIKQVYLLAKFPGRVAAILSRRKKAFDDFRDKYLELSNKQYHNYSELMQNPPEADVFITGSDQVWNPVFQNGHDPSFFLQFVPCESKKISYAASFGGESLGHEDRVRISKWLSKLDSISVRESSGVKLLEEIGIEGCQVCDPVFLVDRQVWEKLAINPKAESYIFVYDFEHDERVERLAKRISRERNLRIVSFFKSNYSDIFCSEAGPLEFLGYIKNAEVVLSNSFHATAFSLIFHKEFFVGLRSENINSRMIDLLRDYSLSERVINDVLYGNNKVIDWNQVDIQLLKERRKAESFIEGFKL